jgi:hypothetical protein
VIVLSRPGSGVFDSVRSETGVDVELLVGGTFLRHFVTTFNYGETELLLARYSSDSHVNPREWIGPGFAVTNGPGGDFRVADVYAGTDAESRGVSEGELLAEVDSMPASGFDLASMRELLSSFDVGETVTFGFREGGIRRIDITVEDLLPDYP